jgi:cation transport regulator ChaC
MPSSGAGLRIAVFGYGSLVSRASAAETLGHDPGPMPVVRLRGWRRRFSQARDNAAAEKTFATPEGTVPPYVLGLNLEPGGEPEEAPNGALLPVTEADLAALDVREMRYDRVDVTAAIEGPGAAAFERVVTYVAKAERFAPEPPPGAVILRTYASTIEAAFDGISAATGARYRETTLPYPAPVVDGVLIADRIPPGNPREW